MVNLDPSTRKKAGYQAHYRRRHPDYVERSANLQKARERAKSRLAKEQPELFNQLLQEEEEKLGVKRVKDRAQLHDETH